VSSFIFLGSTITNAPALLLMDWKMDGVISRAFATTQCLEVLHPLNDLASKETGALRQPRTNQSVNLHTTDDITWTLISLP